jgi:HK97 family phage major capsid protein
VVEISNTLLTQDEINISNYILNDIGRAVMQKLETTILSNAPATATTPAGLFSLIPAQTITPTYEELIDIEYQLETKNIYKDITYITSPSMRKTLKTTETVANTANFLWDKNFDKINGRKALSTNSVLTDGLIVGQFSNLLVCFFGGLECTVDAKSKVLDNITRLICNVYADIAPLRTDSFITATI